MAEVKRRDLLVGAGAIAAAGAGAAVIAADSEGRSRRPLEINVSNGTPVLPTDEHHYHFPLASAKVTATTPGGTVTELTEDNFPIFKGNAAGVFYLVLKPGALREPHWHPNAWEMDYCAEGTGELGVVTPDGDQRIQTLTPGDIGFIPQGWAHYIRNPGPGDMRFVVVFNHSLPNDIGLSTMYGGMPTDTFSQTLGVPAQTLDAARKSPKTLLIVQRRG
jgi:oxalate decarboxylase